MGDLRFHSKTNPFVLFFIADMVPTPDEKAQAAELIGTVAFRNINFIGDEDSLEPCDAVAGLIPMLYRNSPVAVVKAEFTTAATVVPESVSKPLAHPVVDVSKPKGNGKTTPTIWSTQ